MRLVYQVTYRHQDIQVEVFVEASDRRDAHRKADARLHAEVMGASRFTCCRIVLNNTKPEGYPHVAPSPVGC